MTKNAPSTTSKNTQAGRAAWSRGIEQEMPDRMMPATIALACAERSGTDLIKYFVTVGAVKATPSELATAIGWLFVRGAVDEHYLWILPVSKGAPHLDPELRQIGNVLAWADSQPDTGVMRFARFWRAGWLALVEPSTPSAANDYEDFTPSRLQQVRMYDRARPYALAFFELAYASLLELSDMPPEPTMDVVGGILTKTVRGEPFFSTAPKESEEPFFESSESNKTAS
jgi:hypothetical protein